MRNWKYPVLLAVGGLAATPFLVGAASASSPPPVPPAKPKVAPPPKSALVATASTPFTCGEVATKSITLTSNEDCPGTTAIYVGANSITINLNGFTLSGDTTHAGISDSGFNGVTIKNGAIINFQDGVVVEADSSHVTDLWVAGNGEFGIYASGNADVVAGNVVTQNGVAVELALGSGDQAIGNTIESSSSYGLYAYGITGLTVSGDKALNGSSYGIVVGGSTGKVSGNVANGNASAGIYLNSPPSTGYKSGLTAAANRAAFNGDYGVLNYPNGSVDGGGNVVQDNGNAAQCLNIVCHEVSN